MWSQECCRISPSCFLAKFHNRRLKQDSFVSLYFVLFAFFELCLVCVFPVLFCLSVSVKWFWQWRPPPKWPGLCRLERYTPTQRQDSLNNRCIEWYIGRAHWHSLLSLPQFLFCILVRSINGYCRYPSVFAGSAAALQDKINNQYDFCAF